MIIRERWLKKIRPFYDSELIKVITGIRRCGKSVILKQISNEINADDSHKIMINFEDMQFNSIQDEISLYNYIKSLIKDTQKYYLFFDEIQNVTGYERAINSFRLLNTSIFITGSNAHLLSGELATMLSGRYISFKIMPFSFAESMEIQGIKNPDDKDLMNYLRYGGMPQRFLMNSEDELKVFFSDLYDSIILKDIVARYKIQNIDLLKRIFTYLARTTSQLFSASSITKFLKNEGRDCSKESLYNYISYIIASCVMNKAPRYDIRGKRVLATLEKYYLADISFAYLNTSKLDIGASLENIVYNELLCRGYDVSVGILRDAEIDFIAEKGNEKLYFQVCYLLASEDTIQREFGAYKKVSDNYPKYVLSTDKYDFSQDGIVHYNLIDWLVGYEQH